MRPKNKGSDTHTHTHTHARQFALPGPLNWPRNHENVANVVRGRFLHVQVLLSTPLPCPVGVFYASPSDDVLGVAMATAGDVTAGTLAGRLMACVRRVGVFAVDLVVWTVTSANSPEKSADNASLQAATGVT